MEQDKKNSLIKYTLNEKNPYRLLGRTSLHQEVAALFWSGSGIEITSQCTQLWLEVEVDYLHFEPWISMEMNGSWISRQMLVEGRYLVPIFRNVSGEGINTVRIFKDVQAMPEDEKHSLLIHGIYCDGQLLPVEEKLIKIEFIGDSITSGEGCMGAYSEQEWISSWFGVMNGFPYQLSKKLNGEFRILSQSGWGVVCSWDNNPYCNLPAYYEQICGVVKGENNIRLGAQDNNDFSKWQPDLIVVNLGSNDNGAFHQLPWYDESTNETFALKMLDELTFDHNDVALFQERVILFLEKLRKYNEKAKIIWAYGMLGNELSSFIERALNNYKAKNLDEQVYFLPLTNTKEKEMGSRSHPGKVAHQRAAEELFTFIKGLGGS